MLVLDLFNCSLNSLIATVAQQKDEKTHNRSLQLVQKTYGCLHATDFVRNEQNSLGGRKFSLV